MLFKNATVVRLTGDIPVTAEEIEKALAPHKFVPARDMESEKYGWIAPTEDEEDSLVRAQGSVFLLALKVQKKILPESVINEELKERLAVRPPHARRIRAKERQQMKDEIRFDLLPRAFSKYSRTLGYIDMQRREIVIGTGTSAQVDEFLTCLRTAFGSLPATLLEAEYSPQARMTDWARESSAPPKVQFGEEITLVDPNEGGSGAFRKQDLTSEEIMQCIASGKLVQRIGLKWNDYLSFTVDESLVLRKLAPMDMFDKEFEGDDEDNARLDADLFLTVSALRTLLPELYKWFEVKEAVYTGSTEAIESFGEDFEIPDSLEDAEYDPAEYEMAPELVENDSYESEEYEAQA